MLYHYLTVYGSTYKLNHRIEDPDEFVDWTEENFDYVKYNPRKDINRHGLSITSLDGGVDGIPNLDSLGEYNNENNTNYSEGDFKTFTPVYDYPGLAKCLDPIKDYIYRSHILKVGSGGFFPPHRDFRGMDINNFRIIIPLKNMDPPDLTFVVDDKVQQWDAGSLYFVDTAKMHYLFNCSFEPAYMIVLNVELNEDTVNFVTQHMKHR